MKRWMHHATTIRSRIGPSTPFLASAGFFPGRDDFASLTSIHVTAMH